VVSCDGEKGLHSVGGRGGGALARGCSTLTGGRGGIRRLGRPSQAARQGKRAGVVGF